MGMDVHVHFEYYNEEKQKWVNCDKFKIDEDLLDSKEVFDKEVNKYECASVPYFRDSDIFVILRSKMRGLPNNIHWATKMQMNEWEFDPTWYSLKELLSWRKKMKKKWKKLAENHSITIDYCGEYIELEDGSYVTREYKMLDGIITEAKKALRDAIFIGIDEDFNDYTDKFRIILWFDN